MKVRVVRDRDGQVVTAVQMERTSMDEVLVEPVLEEGQRAEDVHMERSELLDVDTFIAKYSDTSPEQG